MIDELMITPTEVNAELAHLSGMRSFDVFAGEQSLREHGESAKSEYAAYIVSCYALFRSGAFALYPHRDPGASAAYWLHRYAREASRADVLPPDTAEWVVKEEMSILSAGLSLDRLVAARAAATL
jgi:hypothetical protein